MSGGGAVLVNGREMAVAGISVSELLGRLDLLNRRVAVERNGEIVARSLHAATALAAGDRLEIVVAVGGG